MTVIQLFPRHPGLDLPAFCQRLREDDVIAKFEAWYKERHAEDPESWPLDGMSPAAWLGLFEDFLSGHKL